MTINKYFNHHENEAEQDLIEDMTIEIIQMAGMDLHYIQRETVDEDYLYSEDPSNIYTDQNVIEMYLDSVDGFGADLDMITGFGLEITETADFIVSKKRFAQEFDIGQPREGDLIYIPMTSSLMEIKKIKVDDPFYQKGKTYVWKLTVELFEYSQETFDTGINVVDDLMNSFSTEEDLENDSSANNNEVDTESNQYRTFDENDPFGQY